MRGYSKRNQRQYEALRDQANASPIILWQNGKWQSRKICNASYTCGAFFLWKKKWIYKIFHIIPGAFQETLKPNLAMGTLDFCMKNRRERKIHIFIRSFSVADTQLTYHPTFTEAMEDRACDSCGQIQKLQTLWSPGSYTFTEIILPASLSRGSNFFSLSAQS